MKVEDMVLEFATSTDGLDQFITDLETMLKFAKEAKQTLTELNGKQVIVGLELNKTAQVNEPNCQVVLDSEKIIKAVASQMEKSAIDDIHGEAQKQY